MPYWLQSPCPAWCGIHHGKYDHGSDRWHASEWSASVRLSLEDPDRHGVYGSYSYSVPALDVFVSQGHRESEPRIEVEGGAPNSGRNFEMTSAEALALAKALTTAADVAEGHCNPGR